MATLKVNIDPSLKDEVEHLFTALGLSVEEAITLFYQEVKLVHGLPFESHIPNETTRQVFQDTDANRHLVRCENAEDLFSKLGI